MSVGTGTNQYMNLAVNLPNRPALAGIQRFFPAVMPDASDAGGLTTSNGAAFTIGNQCPVGARGERRDAARLTLCRSSMRAHWCS